LQADKIKKMAKFKFHWGWAILLVFITFMTIFAYQFYLSIKINRTNDLVVEDYYTAELQYGEEIKKIHAADSMKQPVEVFIQDKRPVLKFPKYINPSEVDGEIEFQRIDNKLLDKTFKIRLDSTNTQLFAKDSFVYGRWNYIIRWKTDSTAYLKKGKLFIK
jgi:hypothetical protein